MVRVTDKAVIVLVGVLTLVLVLVSNLWYKIGRTDVQHKAVMLGHAVYKVDMHRHVSFEWLATCTIEMEASNAVLQR